MTDKPCILIVDDNPDNIRVLGTILRQNNYRVIIAQSGLQALKTLEITAADLVLLDVMMPEMDGFEACKRIKANPEWNYIPVIFLTAKVEESEVIKGLEIGAVDYITKPFNTSILLARVQTHVQLHQYHQLLREQAFLDGLTLIPNRLRFESLLLNEWNRALRSNTHLSVIMIDIDYFKSLNDNYGHLAGDQALKQIAQTLNSVAKRAGDFVARYGGEEFVVVLSHTELSGALAVAETMRAEVEKLQIKNEKAPLQYVTISLGVASQIPSETSTAMQLVDKADQQLLLAKNSGKNQVYSKS